MEKHMARLPDLAVALIVAAVSIAPLGAAQAAPPANDSRYVVADRQASETNVAEGIFIVPKATQGADQRAAKPRIWISMGFGF
jgi:hypothetical protein